MACATTFFIFYGRTQMQRSESDVHGPRGYRARTAGTRGWALGSAQEHNQTCTNEAVTRPRLYVHRPNRVRWMRVVGASDPNPIRTCVRASRTLVGMRGPPRKKRKRRWTTAGQERESEKGVRKRPPCYVWVPQKRICRKWPPSAPPLAMVGGAVPGEDGLGKPGPDQA